MHVLISQHVRKIFYLFLQLRVFRQVLKPKHHKRHKRTTKTAEEAVLDELGIKNNPVEKEKLRNSLEVSSEF